MIKIFLTGIITFICSIVLCEYLNELRKSYRHYESFNHFYDYYNFNDIKEMPFFRSLIGCDYSSLERFIIIKVHSEFDCYVIKFDNVNNVDKFFKSTKKKMLFGIINFSSNGKKYADNSFFCNYLLDLINKDKFSIIQYFYLDPGGEMKTEYLLVDPIEAFVNILQENNIPYIEHDCSCCSHRLYKKPNSSNLNDSSIYFISFKKQWENLNSGRILINKAEANWITEQAKKKFQEEKLKKGNSK